MRRANGAEAVKSEDGTIYAINLGADFCAEHEWGVKRLRSIMGIPENEPRTGLNYHSAKVGVGDNLMSFVSKKTHFLVLDGVLSYYQNDKKRLGELKEYYVKGARELGFITWRGDKKPQVLATAWDEGSFGIVIGKDADVELKTFGVKLAEAIGSGDYSVWFGGNGGNPFSRSGLVVAITSLVPQDVKDYMTQAYKELAQLEADDAATGVKQLLAAKGKKYYACSPQRQADGSIKYFLNPQEQRTNNFGWFTVQELTDWANGVVGNKVDKVK
jgi:hypothetical protein